MAQQNDILFIQNRAHKAGAQTSFNRIAQALIGHDCRPVALLAEQGWLSKEFRSQNLPLIVSRWPSPRSFQARLGGLNYFAKKSVNKLRFAGIQPKVIIANDHQECPLTIAIAKRLQIPALAILRSSSMTRSDFSKYHCDKISHLFTVGSTLTQRVSTWTNTPVSTYNEGFTAAELSLPERQLPSSFPSKILIVGTNSEEKGYSDFLHALMQIECDNLDFSNLECVFTSTAPDSEKFRKLLSHPYRSNLIFHGRVDNLQSFSQGFNFAVHPSRRETFGMAPLEIILAGTPTLCTETGVLNSSLLPQSWLTPTHTPSEMAQSLNLWTNNWQEQISHLQKTKTLISEKYNLNKTSKDLVELICTSCGT